MPNIRFVEADGSSQEVEASVGDTLMEVAVNNGVEGILGDCGGAMSCATCHCYLDDVAYSIAGEPSEIEAVMMKDLLDIRPTSRLACQVTVSAELDGVQIDLPEAQY